MAVGGGHTITEGMSLTHLSIPLATEFCVKSIKGRQGQLGCYTTRPTDALEDPCSGGPQAERGRPHDRARSSSGYKSHEDRNAARGLRSTARTFAQLQSKLGLVQTSPASGYMFKDRRYQGLEHRIPRPEGSTSSSAVPPE
ncbi:hypothetical protein RF11_16291 [Thelohanellus kitauei]|uniref:Uncharacterized protein n=1 Tax=Thelohanellus kitauei TaxID=669202 RepID=A0A0C2N428_THEKT|nr:hypothetical protein RF11_16291 [Thelohanellus kitauei]